MAGIPRIFVSYAHADAHLIGKLGVLEILEGLGFDLWFDHRNGLRAGDHIDHTIAEALASSMGLVALWSPAYVRNGSYTETEYVHAKFTLGLPTAVLLIENVRPTDLGSAMSRLVVPSKSLQQCPPEVGPTFVAKALLEANIRLPRGAPADLSGGVDLAALAISPTFEEIARLRPEELDRRMERLQRILAGNPNSPYHCINAALLALHMSNEQLASELAQRALSQLPHDGIINYCAAVVATALHPLVRGPRERIASIWDLAERAKRQDVSDKLPSLIQAAIALDYHGCVGSLPPIPIDTLMRKFHFDAADRSELLRLRAVFKRSAPIFYRRLFEPVSLR